MGISKNFCRNSCEISMNIWWTLRRNICDMSTTCREISATYLRNPEDLSQKVERHFQAKCIGHANDVSTTIRSKFDERSVTCWRHVWECSATFRPTFVEVSITCLRISDGVSLTFRWHVCDMFMEFNRIVHGIFDGKRFVGRALRMSKFPLSVSNFICFIGAFIFVCKSSVEIFKSRTFPVAIFKFCFLCQTSVLTFSVATFMLSWFSACSETLKFGRSGVKTSRFFMSNFGVLASHVFVFLLSAPARRQHRFWVDVCNMS